MNTNKTTRVAIFASGNGSNAQGIAEYFKNHENVSIVTIITNKKDAFVIERAKQLNIPCQYFNRNDFYETNNVTDYLQQNAVDFIVLAGFLWKLPANILAIYGNNRIINIHPALLPNYGGKGMYGMNVHNAVVENNEKISGITVHFVNENYDEGEIIFQAQCTLLPNETPETLAQKIHELEYKYFPIEIEKVILGL